jgi:hypothetical protein
MPQISSIKIQVVLEDVIRHRADILVLKHAQALFGADKAVYERLTAAGVKVNLPKAGRHEIVDARAAVNAAQVLYIGVEPLRAFGYGEIREFGRRSMAVLAAARYKVGHVAMTLHGPGYGLDEVESFESELAGVLEAISDNKCPAALESVTFVERDVGRVRRLEVVLARLLPGGMFERSQQGALSGLNVSAKAALTAGYGSDLKPRVFVAMPFADEMYDVFHYGIQGAVNSLGMLAERADTANFTGDVLSWVQQRIGSAKLVVADLTGSNPNVFLEVGYAWGRAVPTVLLSKNGSELKFDVKGQRCIEYSSIRDLEQKLSKELAGLFLTQP